MCIYKSYRASQFSQSSMNKYYRIYNSLLIILTISIYFYIVCFGFLTSHFIFLQNAINISSIFFPFSSPHTYKIKMNLIDFPFLNYSQQQKY